MAKNLTNGVKVLCFCLQINILMHAFIELQSHPIEKLVSQHSGNPLQ